MSIKHLTNTDFDAEIAHGITLVDFWADWCGPCKMLAPAVEELAEKYDGKVNICKVDIDAEPELAARYGVMSIPTLISFVDGEPKYKCVGVQPMEVLEEMIQ